MYDVKDECYYHINTGQELNLGAILEIGHKYNKFYNEIYNRNPDKFKNDSTVIERLIRMQHYGVPTRLLDITRNPLVALYFAVKDETLDQDGYVFLLKENVENIRELTDKLVSAIANLAI